MADLYENRIGKLLNELKSLVMNDAYALTEDDINSLSWKIDKLRDDILKTYEGKVID